MSKRLPRNDRHSESILYNFGHILLEVYIRFTGDLFRDVLKFPPMKINFLLTNLLEGKFGTLNFRGQREVLIERERYN